MKIGGEIKSSPKFYPKMTRTEKIMGISIIAIIIIFFFRECSNQNDKNNLVNDISTYKDTAQFYSLKVNGIAVDVAYNKSLQLENKNQLESIIKKNDTLAKLISKFKAVSSTTIINNITNISGDTIKLADSIPCDFKPFQVRRDSIYYHFLGTISPKYFSIDSLTIPNKQSIVIGKKKLGFLKGTEERAEIINSNPLIKTTNIESYVINKKKKRLGIGPSIGYGFQFNPTGVRTGIFLGVSAQYNLIQF